MINEDVIAIKDNILNTVGDKCEKIIFFGSYVYGTPHNDSDYDFYVVLKDGTEKPILVYRKFTATSAIPSIFPLIYWQTTKNVMNGEERNPL
jgi:predicted nucleotidyltransferase